MNESALLYNEPDIKIILTLGSFIILLNVVGSIFDKLFHCGLLGQIFLGVAWGMPGSKWLSISMQETIVQLGYTGLILLVYEGGLASNFRVMRSNFLLSSSLALTGVVTTIGISFILIGIANASPLQAFAAGAALSSTSLGTTFTILKGSGLISSNLGVIISSAAMLDDVSGLIMAQIISKLGNSETSFSAVTIVRPVFVSIAFGIGVPFICFSVIKPFVNKWRIFYSKWPFKRVSVVQMSLLLHTAILIGFVAASSFAGTSNLFGAYLAGACISWYDGEITKNFQLSPEPITNLELDRLDIAKGSSCSEAVLPCPIELSSTQVGSENINVQPLSRFQENIERPVAAVLKYSKGSLADQCKGRVQDLKSPEFSEECRGALLEMATGDCTWQAFYDKPVSAILKPFFFSSIGFSIPISQMFQGSVVWRGLVYSLMMTLAKLLCGVWLLRLSVDPTTSYDVNNKNKFRKLPRLNFWNHALIVGCAMVARGEIGFLIAAIAQSQGIFSSDQFLVVMWSIMICTIIGPITVGVLARNISRKQILKSDDSK